MVQLYLRQEMEKGAAHHVWADTEWNSLSEAQKAFPNERFRIVRLGVTPQDSPSSKPVLATA